MPNHVRLTYLERERQSLEIRIRSLGDGIIDRARRRNLESRLESLNPSPSAVVIDGGFYGPTWINRQYAVLRNLLDETQEEQLVPAEPSPFATYHYSYDPSGGGTTGNNAITFHELEPESELRPGGNYSREDLLEHARELLAQRMASTIRSPIETEEEYERTIRAITQSPSQFPNEFPGTTRLEQETTPNGNPFFRRMLKRMHKSEDPRVPKEGSEISYAPKLTEYMHQSQIARGQDFSYRLILTTV